MKTKFCSYLEIGFPDKALSQTEQYCLFIWLSKGKNTEVPKSQVSRRVLVTHGEPMAVPGRRRSVCQDCFSGWGRREAEFTSSPACSESCHLHPPVVVRWRFEADLHLSDGMWCKYAVISGIQAYRRCSLKTPVCHSEELVIISSHIFRDRS